MKGLPQNVLLNFRLEIPKSDLTIYLPSGISEIFCQMVSTPGFRLFQNSFLVFKDQCIAFNFVQKLFFFYLEEKLPMRKQTRSAKTLPPLSTGNVPAESCQNKTNNDHQRTNRSNLRKTRIERKALSSLQNCVRIYIHKCYYRSYRELLSVYTDHCLAFRLYMILVIEV